MTMKKIFEYLTRPFRNIFRALFKDPEAEPEGLSEEIWNQIDEYFGEFPSQEEKQTPFGRQ
jgi:hypothetical protein